MTDEKKALLAKIKRDVLGYSSYGFLDHTKWKDFQRKYFARSGQVNNDAYSAQVNQHLSRAALQHTLEEVYKRLEQFFEKESAATVEQWQCSNCHALLGYGEKPLPHRCQSRVIPEPLKTD